MPTPSTDSASSRCRMGGRRRQSAFSARRSPSLPITMKRSSIERSLFKFQEICLPLAPNCRAYSRVFREDTGQTLSAGRRKLFSPDYPARADLVYSPAQFLIHKEVHHEEATFSYRPLSTATSGSNRRIR